MSVVVIVVSVPVLWDDCCWPRQEEEARQVDGHGRQRWRWWRRRQRLRRWRQLRQCSF